MASEFKFKFEFLLKHRKRLEDLASIEYSEAKHNLDKALGQIQKMYDSIESTRSLISDLQKSASGQSLSTIIEGDQFIEGQKIRIARDRIQARELMAIVEEKQSKLIEVAKDHKIIQKLKERQKKQFRKAYRKQEIKRIDDLVVIRGQRSQKGRLL